MFCKNCGQQIQDGAVNCPNCGTPVAQTNSGFNMDAIKSTVNSGVTAVKSNANVKKLLPIGIAAVAVILVIVLFFSFFTRSAKSAAVNYLEAKYDGDFKTMDKYTAIDQKKLIEARIEADDDYEYDSYSEYCEEMSEDYLDEMEDQYGDDYSVDVEFKKVSKEYDDDEVEDFIDDVEEEIDYLEKMADEADVELEGLLDPQDIKAVCEVKLKTTIEYEDEDGDEQKDKSDVKLTCVKIGMKWYVWSY